MGNFHGSRSLVDDWLGCGFWTGRNAAVAGSGHDFDFDEPGFPAHLFDLTPLAGNFLMKTARHILLGYEEFKKSFDFASHLSTTKDQGGL